MGSRFMRFHRMLFLPPLILLTLTCLYTSSTLTRKYQTVLRTAHCFACDSPSPFPVHKSFKSLANFQTTSYIKDVVLRHNVLKVEDSRGEAATESVSRRDDGNDAERARFEGNDGKIVEVGARSETMARIRQEEISHLPPFKHEEPRVKVSEQIPISPVVLGDEPLREQREEEISTNEQKLDNATVRETKKDGGTGERELRVHPTAEMVVETRQEDGEHSENRHSTVSNGDVLTRKAAVDVRSARNVTASPLIQEFTPVDSIPEKSKFEYEGMPEDLRLSGVEVERLMDAVLESGLPNLGRNSDSSAGNKDVAQDNLSILRGGIPQGSPIKEEGTCDGRRIYVYELPSKFNSDLVGQCDTLLSWFNFCDYFMNDGMGLTVSADAVNDRGEQVLVPAGSWYLTHMYALELIFHARLKHYPCLTTDANEASLFFIPYYAGLDVIRWNFENNASSHQRDALSYDLVNWLDTQDSWKRNGGLDHVLVVGKIGWDFRRFDDGDNWGTKLLVLPSMFSPTKLLIERDPWHENDVGVPHPTFFHPKDDEEIRTWLAHAERSERRHLVSFAGMPRPNMLGNVRGHLIQQCLDHPDECFLLKCEKRVCLRPDSTIDLFLHSHFCMQPPGDSPTRRSLFDSLIGGCIPVLFDPYTAYYQYPWHLPQNASSYSVFIPSAQVMGGKADIVDILRSISPGERTAMRTRIIHEIVPGLLYSKPGTKHSDFQDAFDISLHGLLNRVANIRAQHQAV